MAALPLSASDFRTLAAQVTTLAAEYLAGLDGRRTFPRVSGAQSHKLFGEVLPENGLGPAAFTALHEVLELSRPPSPRFFGYVLGSGEPVAALADLLASVLNQNVTAWRSAPAAVALERELIGALAAALGCPGYHGSFCGGGSMANLMALAMAREAQLPANEDGVRAGVVYASSEAHMSIPKAMAVLGLGRKNLRLIPTDASWRMNVSQLRQAIAADRSAGRAPFAVVATSGTVNTGSIDPLAQIAALCHEYDLWMHIDGAYGALAALAAPERFEGLNAADSISLDPHKWLYQPLDCGVLLFRDAAAARKAFSYTGDYAKSLDDDPLEGFAFFEESLELSRRFRALKLWLSLRYHGMQAFRGAIGADLRHAQLLAQQVAASPRLELMAPVSLSAVCFRYRAETAGVDEDRLNAAMLKRVIERGSVYLSNATLGGRFALRACFVNHRTTEADVARIVPEVLAAAQELLAES
ncbi:MAG TPA: aminotransferase class V-fold PLP-dependent enzyme [Steroidobacteraceae bacterium]|jgi:glutamate/tyrosine decarboxylase-like PLP-dependent enzyme|nr:aminotransferase class V-fold PLP-dependent enzyme [Steroidobacteraceae bacterium]